MRRWSQVTVACGTIAVLASCSGAPVQSEEHCEHGSGRDCRHPCKLCTAHEICQLIGDFDYAARPGVVPTEEHDVHELRDPRDRRGFRRSSTRMIRKIFYYFGDTNPDPNGLGYDVVGWSGSQQGRRTAARCCNSAASSSTTRSRRARRSLRHRRRSPTGIAQARGKWRVLQPRRPANLPLLQCHS